MSSIEALLVRAQELMPHETMQLSVEHGRFRAAIPYRHYAYGPTLEVALVALVAELEVLDAQAREVKAIVRAHNDNERAAVEQAQ